METQGLKVIEKAYQNAPKHLQNQKNESIAKFSIYCSQLYLEHSNNYSDVAKAKRRLLKGIKLYPLILFSKHTYILLVRILRKQLPANHILNRLIIALKQPFKMKKFR